MKSESEKSIETRLEDGRAGAEDRYTGDRRRPSHWTAGLPDHDRAAAAGSECEHSSE